MIAAAVGYLAWLVDGGLRFNVLFFVALGFSMTAGIKIWLPMWKSFPPTFGDGIFQISDIIYTLKLIVTTALVLLPWILPFREVLS